MAPFPLVIFLDDDQKPSNDDRVFIDSRHASIHERAQHVIPMFVALWVATLNRRRISISGHRALQEQMPAHRLGQPVFRNGVANKAERHNFD